MHSTSDSRTKRLLDLVVLLLDARRPISFAELREQFSEYRSAKPEAGQRAYERDKSTLLEMGVPLRYVTAEESADAPAEGGYIIDRQKYRLPEVSLTADEVAVLVSTAAAARHQSDFPYRHAAELAVRKLMFDLSGLPSKSRRRRPPRAAGPTAEGEKGGVATDVLVHLPTTFKSGSIAEHLEQLEAAIHNHKRVSFEYGAHRGSGWGGAEELAGAGPDGGGGVVGPSERDVDPYGLVYRQGAWLLVGFCHKAQALRRFRVDRILQLKVAPRPRTPDFEVPKDFSLQEHGVISPWRFDREPPVRARLWVSDETPWVVDEDFGPTTRAAGQDHGAGGSVVEFECKNPDYLVSRVLGAAGTLRVLAPPALRTRVAEAAATVGRRNGPQSGGSRTVSGAEGESIKSAPRGATAS
ncbi:MAG TPA: WYL domain-containing protein [Pseudomonadota bacterium]|nr:WYL domain-containing protein [Pseudomonadota bacterium]